MRRYIAAMLLAIPAISAAGENCGNLLSLDGNGRHWCLCERPLQRDGDLRDWCEDASRIYLRSYKEMPYSWTAKYWSKGYMLYAEGEWRLDHKRAYVQCSIPQGSAASGATMTVAIGKKGEREENTVSGQVALHCGR